MRYSILLLGIIVIILLSLPHMMKTTKFVYNYSELKGVHKTKEYRTHFRNFSLNRIEKEVYDLVNEIRKEHGVGILGWNPDLAYVARKHSQDMAENDFFDHVNLKGEKAVDRLKNEGIYYYNATAENIAYGSAIKSYLIDQFGNKIDIKYRTEDELALDAVRGWMNSTPHRESILNPEYTETGVGVVLDPDDNLTYYFTQLFITRVYCGYLGAECCEGGGCYLPAVCRDGICE